VEFATPGAFKRIALGFFLLFAGVTALWAWLKYQSHRHWIEVCNGTPSALQEISVVVRRDPEPARPLLSPGECVIFDFHRRGVAGKGSYGISLRTPAGSIERFGGCGYFSLGLPPQKEHATIVPEGKHLTVTCGKSERF